MKGLSLRTKSPKSSANFLPGGGVGGAGKGNKDARGRSGDSGFTICTCGLKSRGQCASETANYERAIHPRFLRRDVGEGSGKGQKGGRESEFLKRGEDKKVNNRALNHSQHYRPSPSTPSPITSSNHVLPLMFTFVRAFMVRGLGRSQSLFSFSRSL